MPAAHEWYYIRTSRLHTCINKPMVQVHVADCAILDECMHVYGIVGRKYHNNITAIANVCIQVVKSLCSNTPNRFQIK